MEDNKIKERVATLEESDKNQGNTLEKLTEGLEKLWIEVKEIRQLLMSRPSWLVMGIITALASLSTFLVTYLFFDR